MKRIQKLLRVTTPLVLALGIGMLAPAGAAEPPIKVGVIFPLSGGAGPQASTSPRPSRPWPR